MVPLPLNLICGHQKLNKNIEQESVDDQVFNGIIEKTDHNNESQLFQIWYELNLHHNVI